MKKTIFFLICIAIFTFPALEAQTGTDTPKYYPPEHLFRDVCLSVSPNLLINTPNTMQFAGGLKLSLFMGKHISFDTDIVFGRDYFHAGPGIIGIPIWLLVARNSSSDIELESFSQLAFIIVAMALSAEHTSFHLPVSKSFEVAPYLSLLRYKSAYEYGHYSNTNMVNEQLSFAVGVELNKYIKKLVLSPYVECGAGYRDHRAQINAGIYCGIYIFTKTIQ